MHFTVLNLSYLGNLCDFCFANAFFHNSKFSGQSLEAWITDLFTGHCFNGFFTNIFYVDIELLKIHFILFRDFLTDLLSFFSLSWFWKLLVLNKVFKARTKLSRCKCVHWYRSPTWWYQPFEGNTLPGCIADSTWLRNLQILNGNSSK